VKCRGFTLAEIMVCLLFLSIALLALVSTQIYSLRASGGNRLRHTASIIAYTIMNEKEEALRKDFTASASQAKADVVGHEGFQCAVLEDLLQADFKRITVIIYWRDGQENHEYSIWTYIYKFASSS
jgi:prepilin-type N-terminal cleavage/methylation domain-containing protein